MRTLYITRSVVESMLRNEDLKKNFAFIGFAAKRVSKKKTCCGEKRRLLDSMLHTIKAGIMGLPPGKMREFKEALNVDQVAFNFIAKGESRKLFL